MYGYALFKDSKEAVVAYPMEGYSKDVAGRSFHHGRFVQRMRHAAAACPNVTMREAFVKKLVNGERHVAGACCCCACACACALLHSTSTKHYMCVQPAEHARGHAVAALPTAQGHGFHKSALHCTCASAAVTTPCS